MKDAASTRDTGDHTMATVGTAGLSLAKANSKDPTPRLAEQH